MSHAKYNFLESWQYDDNPQSLWGKCADDMNRCPKFQALSNSAARLYWILVGRAGTKEAIEMLYEWKKKYYADMGIPKSEFDLKLECNPNRGRPVNQFVFPEAHYKKYGYKKSNLSRLMGELSEAGFIKKKINGKMNYRVNLYEFSDDFKKKPCVNSSKTV